MKQQKYYLRDTTINWQKNISHSQFYFQLANQSNYIVMRSTQLSSAPISWHVRQNSADVALNNKQRNQPTNL